MEQKACSLGDEQNGHRFIPANQSCHGTNSAYAFTGRNGWSSYGIQDLDNLTSGFKPDEMIILAARPRSGNESGDNFVENIAFSPKYESSPKNTLVFSLEMSATSLAMRLICGRARVNMNDLRRGFVPKKHAEKLNQISREFQSAHIWVDDTSGLSINQIRAKARRLKSRKKLHLIVVDYLQLISGDSRVQIEKIKYLKFLEGKSMAKELDVPVIVLSQLNRILKKKTRSAFIGFA